MLISILYLINCQIPVTGGTTTMTGGTLKNTVSGGYALYKQGGTVTVTGGSAEPKNF